MENMTDVQPAYAVIIFIKRVKSQPDGIAAHFLSFSPKLLIAEEISIYQFISVYGSMKSSNIHLK
jgi:hypothetical protein